VELHDSRCGGEAVVVAVGEFVALPSETFTVDMRCVTKWSKLGTTSSGVSVDTLLAGVETEAEDVSAWCDGDYTTNVPREDLTDGRAWAVHAFEAESRMSAVITDW
jgi:DMSO/TMAO reductase YedYZ molybdopterin-dependent catalytic subunit